MEDFPKPLSKQSIQKILDQINNSIYKFILLDGKIEFGFFYKFKYNERIIHIIILNNYKIANEYNNIIKVSINNKEKIIELGKLRYSDINLNISIIEINENIENNNYINFLELENKIYEKESDILLNKELLYIIQFNNIKDSNGIYISYGIINHINKNKLYYSSNLNKSANGSLIFNISNNKLIGFNLGKSKLYYNGIFFNEIINRFIKYIKNYKYIRKINKSRSNNNQNNEIDIFINIEKDEVNKEIYFLDNSPYWNNEYLKNYHKKLKELNESNSEIIIDNKKYNFIKYFKPDKEGEHKIKLKFNVNLTDCSNMFAGCKNIKKINFISFNTKYITTMESMFKECEKLKSINLLNINTKSVTNFHNMFYDCHNLNYLDLSSFDTQNAIDMSYMFCGCFNLDNLDLSYFDTKNVTNMSHMFNFCSILKSLNISLFDTKNVINMSSMFSYCKYLNSLDLSFFNTKNVINMDGMFESCEGLINLNLLSFDTRNVKDMSCMFSSCYNLKTLDLSNFDTTNVINAHNIFEHCDENILKSNFYLFNKFKKNYLK